MGAIFLSASVPSREPFSSDCRPQEIQAAVNALAQVALGRRKLVWGGHPAITPLLWAAAQSFGVEYASAVHLFQSRFFKDEDFPKENKHFANVTYVDTVDDDLQKSLAAMRQEMLQSEPFEAAVFIGGMEGIFDEIGMFEKLCPGAKRVPLAITGGASRQLAAQLGYQPPADVGPLDFVSLLYRELAIQPRERRHI